MFGYAIMQIPGRSEPLVVEMEFSIDRLFSAFSPEGIVGHCVELQSESLTEASLHEELLKDASAQTALLNEVSLYVCQHRDEIDAALREYLRTAEGAH